MFRCLVFGSLACSLGFSAPPFFLEKNSVLEAQMAKSVLFMNKEDGNAETCTGHVWKEPNRIRLAKHCVRSQIQARESFFGWSASRPITEEPLKLIFKNHKGETVFNTKNDGDSARLLYPGTFGELESTDYISDLAVIELSRPLAEYIPLRNSKLKPHEAPVGYLPGFPNPARVPDSLRPSAGIGKMMIARGRFMGFVSMCPNREIFVLDILAIPWMSGGPCVTQDGESIGVAIGRTDSGEIGCLSDARVEELLGE